MPKSDLVHLECDFCSNYDTFDIRKPAEEILPIIAKWHGVMDGDSPPQPQADSHRWYDTLECLIAGERNVASLRAEHDKKQAELNQALEKANESLKKSGFMTPKLVTQ